MPTEKEINDLSKADVFTKAFACIQSSWLVIQSIVRVSVGLPISQLELATMAFVVCAPTMYLLWWQKPFGVESRISVTLIVHKESVTRAVADNQSYDSPIYHGRVPWWSTAADQRRQELIQRVDFDQVKPDNAQEDREFYQADLNLFKLFGLIFQGDPSKQSASKTDFIEAGEALRIMVGNVFGNPDFVKPPRELTATLALYATGTLFSALHVAAWNWEFPSSTARELWRIFAITATGTGPVLFLFVFAVFALGEVNINTPDVVFGIVLFSLPFVYAASRIGLVVLIFYCFSSMPAGVYETVNWVQFLPHFS
jgi:hypothetical protein